MLLRAASQVAFIPAPHRGCSALNVYPVRNEERGGEISKHGNTLPQFAASGNTTTRILTTRGKGSEGDMKKMIAEEQQPGECDRGVVPPAPESDSRVPPSTFSAPLKAVSNCQ